MLRVFSLTTLCAFHVMMIVRLAANEVYGKTHPVVRVFIVAGDGNVEGFASKHHLHEMVVGKIDINSKKITSDNQLENSELPYQHLWNPSNSSWIIRDDVFVAYDHHRGLDLVYGPLSVNGSYVGSTITFGPEIQMGHVLGNLYDEPIVIIKAGWDGRTLARDFSSPSKPNTSPGFQWHRMINSIQKVGNSLHEILGDSKYKYSKPTFGGVVWWHGYPDFKIHQMYQEYGDNLVRLIDDLRAELKQPTLPVVVAGLGGHGKRTYDKMEIAFCQMQQKVVEDHYSNRTVVYVPTAEHVRLKPAIKNYTYYYGNAPTMIDIGQAFAAALVGFDPNLKPNMDGNAGFDWVTRDPDITAKSYENSSQTITMITVFVAATVAFAFAAVYFFRGNMRRTWNTAVSRLHSGKTKQNSFSIEYSDERAETDKHINSLI
jgi:hypothetical protein